MSEINNSTKQIRLPILLAVAISAGILIGASVVDPKPVSNESSKAMAKFREVLTNIDRSYVDTVDANQLVDIAIENMLKELDPHTIYVSAEELEMANMRLKGGYDGIGVQFDIVRDTIIVIKPIADGPSDRVGIKAGDKIIKVEEEIVAGVDIDTRGVTDRLLGKKGTQVKISVIHFSETEIKEYTITRGKIPQKTVVASYMATGEIGYIKLVNFGDKSYDEFKQALSDLKEQGMQKLILDLKGNGGGYMAAAEQIADEMIGGDPVIVSQKGKVEHYNSVVHAKSNGIFEEQPIIVLMDEYSASASEIVAGALQDNDRALIVGRRSFGKGLVQMPINLIDGSELRLTIARYYTPTGRSIQKPYVKGDGANYAHDLMTRYEHGEFFYEDSIQVNDSLKFITPKGRVVYGGGGIMPDKFVSYDSTLNTDYFNSLINSRALREFTMSYYLNHRKELEESTLGDYIDDFALTENFLAELMAIGKDLEVEFNQEDYLASKNHIKAYVKAEIASSVWGDAGFYPIYNDVSNESFAKALTLFDEAQALVQRN
jgi:carboxyl-terminal processing protease